MKLHHHHSLFLMLLLAGFSAVGQNTGIGTSSPTTTLDVNGTIRIRGGSPGSGKVLTSDANGLASWKSDNFVAFRAAGLLDGQPLSLTHNAWTKVQFNQSPQYNIGFGYSGISGNFSAPYKGLYHFDIRIELADLQWHMRLRLMQRRGNTTWEAAFMESRGLVSNNGVSLLHDLAISTDLMAEAGDAFWVEAWSYGKVEMQVTPLARSNWFGAHLIKAL